MERAKEEKNRQLDVGDPFAIIESDKGDPTLQQRPSSSDREDAKKGVRELYRSFRISSDSEAGDHTDFDSIRRVYIWSDKEV